MSGLDHLIKLSTIIALTSINHVFIFIFDVVFYRFLICRNYLTSFFSPGFIHFFTFCSCCALVLSWIIHILHYICSHQVQDYYLMLKFNNGDKCHKALYSLFIACCMLHNNRPTGNKSAYNYPKVILSFMLILQHWKQTNYCGYEMMKKCMAIFNEELGELTFSILARSTLGDHCKNNFEHMDRLFKLLPVYRDMKRDVVQDSGRADSLSWRHKIKVDSDEVRSCELFLKQMIRELQNNTYKSYNGLKALLTQSMQPRTKLMQAILLFTQ